MTVTAVPILPVARGTLIKLWAGVGALVLGAGTLAWAGTASVADSGCGDQAFVPAANGAAEPVTTDSGLLYQIVKAGSGARPTDADVALIGYKGRLADGTEFDANPQAPMPVQGVIPGFSEGLKLMQRGGTYRLCIPSALGYGAKGAGDRIPANATLVFEVELFDFRSVAEVQAMQQMQQSQGGAAPQEMPGAR